MKTAPTPRRAGLLIVLLLLFPLLIAYTDAIQAQTIKKMPYLIYQGLNTGMDVCWQLTATSVDTIRWGNDTTYGSGQMVSTEYGADHQHHAVLTGLTPGSLYCYKVVLQSGAAYTSTFHAAPSDSDTTLKFITYGDVRSNPAIHNNVAAAILSSVAADPASQTFLMVNGDLTVSGNNESSWTNEIFNNTYTDIRKLMASMPYQACMGNHEQSGVLYSKYFPISFAGGRYYSFDYGPLHVVVLDQYTSYTPGSAQYNWLHADLAASLKPWKILSFHEPGWTAGGGHFNNTAVQTDIEPLVEKFNVPLVITGHNHYYSRARVIGADGDTVMHVTTGGGGAPLYTPDPNEPNIVKVFMANHFCTVNIQSKNELTMKAVGLDGSTIEQFTVHHHTPVISGAGAINVVQQSADVQWTTDVPANGIMEWGLTPSYGTRVIGTGGVSTHTFPLTNLQPNTLYHYRVYSEDASSSHMTFKTPDVPPLLIPSVQVTFRVNLKIAREKGIFNSIAGDIVTLRGSMNFWGDSTGNADTMKEIGSTEVFTLTRTIDSGTTITWKYWKTLRGGQDYESVTRSMVVGGKDTTLPVVWFNNEGDHPTVEIHISPRWNLVSVPLLIDNSLATNLFPMSITSAYRFTNSYQQSDSLVPGIGYWMKFPSDTTFTLTGSILTGDTVSVVQGWNLIGAISDTLEISSITSDPPGIAISAYWGFENGYKQIPALIPGKAYWIFTTGAGKLILR